MDSQKDKKIEKKRIKQNKTNREKDFGFQKLPSKDLLPEKLFNDELLSLL